MPRNTSLLIGLALVIVLALLAAHPFLTRPGLPRETDAELHVFRAAELGYALQGGAGYVRWAPDFWYGYGYPIFNYYSPLTYYLANAFALVPGIDIVGGTKAVFVLGILLAALGAFLLGRDLFGSHAGLVVAVAYAFAPYILFIDPHIRGDLPEFFALALFPWLLKFQIPHFTFHISNHPSPISNLRTLPSNLQLGLYAALWATLILTHNLMALILSAIVIAWLLWQTNFRFARPCRQARGILNLKLIFLAAGLSAFFWLPFIAERSFIHLTVIGGGHFDFHNHFVAWRTLFGPSLPLDLGAASPQFQLNLGLAQWLLALPAIPFAILHRRKPQGKALLFFIACAALLVFLMLSPSTFLWEHVPLMPYIQFPWRLLGPAALALAMCVGGTVWGIEETRSKKQETGNEKQKGKKQLSPRILHLVSFILHPSSFILLILILALPTMYPPSWSPDFGDTTPLGMLQVELAGHYLGTTSTGDFVPSTVVVDPPANKDLIASYQQGQVDKFDRSTLPPGATASVIEHGPTHDRFSVSSPQPFGARVLTFYFPGWRVQIDGQPVPVRPSGPYGFIEFDMPAGTYDVLVTFGSTLPRTIGTIVSLLTLFIVGFQIAHSRFQIANTKSLISHPQPFTFSLKSEILNFKSEILLITVFVIFKFGIADPCDACFRYTSPPGQVLGAQYKLDPPINFGHHIILMGYDLPSAQVRSSDKLALTLYWKASTPVPKNYQAFVHLIRPATTLWGQSDKLNPGDAPTKRWPLDKFVWDAHLVDVLPGTPPGEYQISVGLYTLDDGTRAPVFDSSGQHTGDNFTLPITIRVLPANTNPANLAMDKRDDITYNGVTLLGHMLESKEVHAPGFARLTLFWKTNNDTPTQPARVGVALVANDQTVAHIETEPTGGIYPPTQWKRGQIVRDIYSLWLDNSIAPGTYIVRVTLDGNQPLDLAQIQVTHNEE